MSRFSDRVADYVRYRPGYPQGVIELLRQRAGLRSGAKIADLGSGTGIFSKMLLESGAEVFAVEPNAEMRAAAEAMLGNHSAFHSFAGSGEATTLENQSVNLIVAAQAFHWFDRERTRAEFSRILKPGGNIALLWNVRRTESTPFLRDYEVLLLTFCADYVEVRHENVDVLAMSLFFTNDAFEKHSFPNTQSFDFDGLRGRLLSCSYAPAPGNPLHEAMVSELRRIFEAHHSDGKIEFVYDTEVFIGT